MHQKSSAKLNCLKLAFLAERPDNTTWQIRYVRLMALNTVLSTQQAPACRRLPLIARHETWDLTAPINNFICPESIKRAWAEVDDFPRDAGDGILPDSHVPAAER